MDISSAIFDSEMGCTAFAVERNTYICSRAGTTSRSETIQVMGCIHPGTPETLRLLPEEEKNEEFIEIYTDYALSTGMPEGSGASFTGSDLIHWNDRIWRVIRVRDWGMFGYCQAYAVLMREGETA